MIVEKPRKSPSELPLRVISTDRSLRGRHFNSVHDLKHLEVTTVEGDYLGVGKTQYAMWMSYGAYQDWDKVLKRLYCDGDEALHDMREAKKNKKPIKLVILDDIGKMFNKHMMQGLKKSKSHMSGVELSYHLSQTMQTARRGVHGIIMTAPDQEELAKVLRDFSNRKVSVKEMSRFNGHYLDWGDRLAITHLFVKSGYGRYLEYEPPPEKFKVDTLPKDVWDVYLDKQYAAERKMDKMIEDREKEFIDEPVKTVKSREQEIAKNLRVMGMSYDNIGLTLWGKPDHTRARRLIATVGGNTNSN